MDVNKTQIIGSGSYENKVAENIGVKASNLAPADYEFLAQIGKGSYGSVFKVKKGDKIIALKVLRFNSEKQKENIQNEIKLLSEISIPECHPSLTCYYDSLTQDNKIFIEMEYIDGVNLEDFARSKRKDQNFIRYMFDILADLTPGMIFLHSKNLIHRDIKPENIIIKLPENQPKLIDVGLACHSQKNEKCSITKSSTLNNKKETCCIGGAGTPFFMAPETLLRNIAYFESDVWSLGASFYFVLTNHHVYQPKIQTYPALQMAARENIELLSTNNLWFDEILEGMTQRNVNDRTNEKNIIPFVEKNKPPLATTWKSSRMDEDF